jgi:hypothetical protein
LANLRSEQAPIGISRFILNAVTLIERSETIGYDGAPMHEHVPRRFVVNDESESPIGPPLANSA